MNRSFPATIKPLSADVIAKVLATSKITTLTDVVLGLVENSLDAGARKIIIDVDFQLGNCTVEDDGIGVEPGNFLESGRLGHPNYTSKIGQDHVFGVSGNFISHLSALSLLTIVSRHADYRSCNSIVFHNSREIARYVPAPEHHLLKSNGHGVRVVVKDLFGNFPLRVGHRAYSVRTQADSDRLMILLRGRLLRLALSIHRSIYISLQDVRSSRLVVLGERATPSPPELQPWRLSFNLDTTLSLLTQSQLIDPGSWSQWLPASLTSKSVVIKGAISLIPGIARKVQFINIGIRPLSYDHESKDLYDHVNGLFKASNFFISEIENRDISGSGKFSKLGSQQSADKWPMFVLNILLLKVTSKLHTNSSSEAMTNQIKDMLSVLITQWLEVNLFRLGKVMKHSYCQTPSGNWTKRVAGAASPVGSESPSNQTIRSKGIAQDDRDKRSTAPESVFPKNQQPEDAHPSSSTITIDSQPRSGSIQVEKYRRTVQRSQIIRSRSAIVGNDSTQQESWIGEFLSQWKNPVFQPPRAQGVSGDEFALPTIVSGYFGSKAGDVLLQPQNISRSALKTGQILGQLDQKFVLAMTSDNNGPGRTLLAIDQHAADERVKVEELLSQLFCVTENEAWEDAGPAPVVAFTRLSPPLFLSISAFEIPRLEEQCNYLSSWGIQFETILAKGGGDTPKILITTLPTVISERCKRDPNLVLEMLRTEAWRREEFPFSFSSNNAVGSSQKYGRKEWVHRIGDCPRGLFNLISSRACRSAIMFNDELDIGQCQRLVSQLSECTFPFQCAHGRPSMVPLLRFGMLEVADESRDVYLRGGLILWEDSGDHRLSLEKTWNKPRYKGDDAVKTGGTAKNLAGETSSRYFA